MSTSEQQNYTGTLKYKAVALDPIHHGSGSEGNTQLLRVQEVMLEDGTLTRVPFVSGNSIKHMIRDGGVRFALEAMTVQAGTFTKGMVDLLFSGGALTKSGSAVNLEQARELSALFPVLSLCGYAAKNFMQQSKIRVGHLHLVCSENRWRLPDDLSDLPQSKQRAVFFRGEDFGTCHEPTRSPVVFDLLTKQEQKHRLESMNGKQQAAKDKKDKKSRQMLYDYEVVNPGSHWFGEIIFAGLSVMELAALRSSLEFASYGRDNGKILYHIGAKTGIGHGRMAFVFSGGLRNTLSPPSFSPTESIMPMDGNADADVMAAYMQHLRENKGAILSSMQELM